MRASVPLPKAEVRTVLSDWRIRKTYGVNDCADAAIATSCPAVPLKVYWSAKRLPPAEGERQSVTASVPLTVSPMLIGVMEQASATTRAELVRGVAWAGTTLVQNPGGTSPKADSVLPSAIATSGSAARTSPSLEPTSS